MRLFALSRFGKFEPAKVGKSLELGKVELKQKISDRFDVFVVLNNDEGDIEKVIENVVYRQLIHMGYKVRVGQLQAGELDFVCTKHDERVYVQVAYLIATEETRSKEFGPLKGIADNYPKYVVSMSPMVKRSNVDGIIHFGLREFLLNGL